MVAKNTICLWYDGTALDAAQFYAATFPDSAVGAVLRAPGDYPAGKQGDVLTVEFTVIGIPCDAKWRTPEGIALGGPRHFGYDIDFVPLEQRFRRAVPA